MRLKTLGVLMLDTTFERIVGDIGNPASFEMPVLFKTVNGATVDRIVKEQDRNLIEPFIEAAKELEKEGVSAITTSCGFLAMFQKEISREVEVPFYSSSLMQIPLVHAITGGPLGVLTARKQSLTENHFRSVDAHDAVKVVYGMDDMHAFTSAIVDQTKPLDKEAIEAEMVAIAKQMYHDHPEIKAIVLECTNMPPYKQAIQAAVNLPVYDIFSLTDFVFSSLPQE